MCIRDRARLISLGMPDEKEWTAFMASSEKIALGDVYKRQAYAVISVGKDNSYGHPTDDVLSRLRDAEAEVYRTDLQGDIIFTSNGKTVTVSTAKNVGKDTLMAPGSSAEKPLTPSATEVQPEQPAPELQQKPAGTDYIINVNTCLLYTSRCV